jgi:hypothetical protein
VNNPLEIRKVVGCVILTLAWVCTFLFIPSSLVIDWVGDGSTTTNLKLLVVVIGLLILIAYHIFYSSTAETNKLSWTTALTLSWISLIIFYPFKDPANLSSGSVAFFALLGGLLVCVLWVRFFSDEVIA